MTIRPHVNCPGSHDHYSGRQVSASTDTIQFIRIRQKTGEQVVGVRCDQRQQHISAVNLFQC